MDVGTVLDGLRLAYRFPRRVYSALKASLQETLKASLQERLAPSLRSLSRSRSQSATVAARERLPEILFSRGRSASFRGFRFRNLLCHSDEDLDRGWLLFVGGRMGTVDIRNRGIARRGGSVDVCFAHAASGSDSEDVDVTLLTQRMFELVKQATVDEVSSPEELGKVMGQPRQWAAATVDFGRGGPHSVDRRRIAVARLR